MSENPTPPSIHHKRRWFYVLWCTLLLLSLGAYGLWQHPKRMEKPRFIIQMTAATLPKGVAVQVWIGPRGRWPGPAWDGQNARFTLRADASGRLDMPATEVPVGVRRWVAKGTVPSRTHDLVVLRFLAPGETVRYAFISLGQDWRTGLLRDGKRLFFIFQPTWQELSLDGNLPAELR